MEVEDGENSASAGRGSKVQGGEGGVEMEVEDGEDGASAGRVEGGADATTKYQVPRRRCHTYLKKEKMRFGILLRPH